MLSVLIHPTSPCKGICRLEGSSCVGCGRVVGEITEWPSASAERKQAIKVLAAERLAIITANSMLQDGTP